MKIMVSWCALVCKDCRMNRNIHLPGCAGHGGGIGGVRPCVLAISKVTGQERVGTDSVLTWRHTGQN